MKKCKSAILVESRKKNKYVYERKLKKTTLCHPLLHFLLTLMENGTNGEEWIRQLEDDSVIIDGWGDIFMYPKLEELLMLLAPVQSGKTYFLHYLNVVTHMHRLKILRGSDNRLKIPVNLPVDQSKLRIAIDTAAALDFETTFCFIIRDENDFEKVDTLLSQVHINNPEFHAFYDGTNLDFFRENIFIDEEEIEAVRPSSQEIYARGKVNPLKFGHLIVSAAGGVYADVNGGSLGIIGKHSLYDIILKEMSSGKSWRKSRTNVLPCKGCTFEMLCPPISNYNTVIGKNNLCHISTLGSNHHPLPIPFQNIC